MFIKTNIVTTHESYEYFEAMKAEKIYVKQYISYYHETENPEYSQIFWSDGHYMFYLISTNTLDKIIYKGE